MTDGVPIQQWVFHGKVTRVVDGDTLDVELDVGFHTRRIERLRLLDCNAPEMSTDAGRVVKDRVVAWCGDAAWRGTLRPAGQDHVDFPVIVQTQKTDSFGRYLANVWNVDGGSLNAFVRVETESLKLAGVDDGTTEVHGS